MSRQDPQARLAALAQRLADACPPELGEEIAVTGSVGARLADEHSDLELVFMGSEVPSVEEVRRWLGSVGAVEVLAGAEPGGVWAWCRFDGVEVEPYWSAIAGTEANVDAILAGDAMDHARLAVAHVLTHCLVVRGSGALDRLTERCRAYPEALGRRLVAEAVMGWEIPSARLGGALRGDRVALQSFLVNDAQRVLRIVFALNRRWEPPQWKWLAHYAADLAVAPLRLVGRLEAALVEPDHVAAVRALHQLERDVLALLPPDIDAEAARRGTDARLAQLAA